jgi:hypothetical protein
MTLTGIMMSTASHKKEFSRFMKTPKLIDYTFIFYYFDV